MPTPLRIISSMATKALLADLAALWTAQAPEFALYIESVGGVDAAKRVQAGEAFDGVVLASNAIDRLMQSGQVLQDSRVDLVHSGVAVAVQQGANRPDIGSETALQQAILEASSLGYSTGPSGLQLAQLFDQWGITERIQERIVQAPPGVSVASMIAQGQVALGFQQLSEMRGVAGITVLGPLPEPVQIITTFSGSVAANSAQPRAVQALLTFWASPACAALKQTHGMDPA